MASTMARCSIRWRPSILFVVSIVLVTLATGVTSLSSNQPRADPTSVGTTTTNNNQISFGSVLRTNLITSDDNNNGQDPKNNDNPATKDPSWQYWCDPCACGFNKLKSYNEHLIGKRHAAVLDQAERLWDEYQQSGPVFYDASIPREMVTRAWSLDLFLDGLQARSRSSIKHVLSSTSTSSSIGGSGSGGGQVDPSIRLTDLSAMKRATLWRHLQTSNVPNLAAMVAALPTKYVRIKELLESMEVFGHVERLMKRSTIQGQKARKFSHMYDIGCGHGLVGMLCAATFPQIVVHALDRVPRESFQAQRQAFQSTGINLDNLQFMAGDLTLLQDADSTATDNSEGDDNHSLLLCVHGCKELTHESIELAKDNHWAWLVLPCCLQAEHHLDAATTTLKVSDDVRFAMLCGAMTAKYQPETVATIDRKITARGIVLSSSSS